MYGALLARVPLFADLDGAERDRLAKLAQIKRIRKDECLFRQQDAGSFCFLVVSGRIKIFCTAPDGREITLAVLGPNDCFGEISLLDGRGRSASASALDDGDLLILPRDAFLRFLQESPESAITLLQVIAGRLRGATEKIESLVFCSVRARLAKLLLDWAETSGRPAPGGTAVIQQLTHQEMANVIGTSRETVSRMLQEFKRAGWLRSQGKQMTLTDPVALAQVVQEKR